MLKARRQVDVVLTGWLQFQLEQREKEVEEEAKEAQRMKEDEKEDEKDPPRSDEEEDLMSQCVSSCSESELSDCSVDWGAEEDERRKTHDPELDEALEDLEPPKVADSAASQFPFTKEYDIDHELLSKVDAAAHAAYDATSKFREEMIHPRINSCIRWLQKNMKDFETQAVEIFGSRCYHLELCSSDTDIVVILGPGQNVKTWLNQLRRRSDSDPAFKGERFQMSDTLQTTYMRVPVDIKAVKLNRTSDGACRSSDSLKHLIDRRIANQEDCGRVMLRAILIFKLVLHYLGVVQRHWKGSGANFKAISLSFWAVLVLDNSEGCFTVGDYVYTLCQNFVDYDWKRYQLVVSAAGQMSVSWKQDLTAVVCIMTDDGKVNSSQNVTVAHLEKSLDAMKKALPKLDQVIEGALAHQDIAGRTSRLEEVHLPDQGAKVAESAASEVPLPLPPPPPPPPPPSIAPGEFKFGKETGVIVAPPLGTDHDSAPIILLLPPSGGFHQAEKKQQADGPLKIPFNCPEPCWYAYMNCGNWKAKLPLEVLQFVSFISSRAKNRAIIGWGLSQGANWLIELTRGHDGLLDAAVIFAGYPQTKCQHEQRSCAQELIAIRKCAICMVHFTADECCGVSSFPDWHGVFVRHMAIMDGSVAKVAESAASSSSKPPPLPASSFLSLMLDGSHSAGYPIWFDWQVGCHPVFKQWWEMLWQKLVIRR